MPLLTGESEVFDAEVDAFGVIELAELVSDLAFRNTRREDAALGGRDGFGRASAFSSSAEDAL